MPLTTDYAAAELFLKGASPELAASQGTDFSSLFEIAQKAFQGESKANKVLLIISDGEGHDESAEAKLKELAEDGVIVYTVGLGTTQGAYVPYQLGNRIDLKKDENLNEVFKIGHDVT